MRISPRFLAWTTLWVVALAAMWQGARVAGRAFDGYMKSGEATVASALSILPATADGFVFEPDPVARWKFFRRWKLDASLQEFSRLRPFLEAWGIAQPKVSPLEGALLRFWPRSLAVAWSTERETVWFVSPIGNRWETIRWLGDLALGSNRRPADFRVERRGNQWWIEVGDASLAPEGYVIHLAVVRGIAVLGIGPRASSPLAPILTPEGRGILCDPEALAALDGALRPNAGMTGFVRFMHTGHHRHAISWRLTPEGAGDDPVAFVLDLRIPSSHARSLSSSVPDAARLAALAQPDDIMAVVASRPDLSVLQKLCAESFPSPITARVGQAGLAWVPEPFRPVWEPILDKLGDRVFIGIGEPSYSSEKGHLSLPRTVMAFPFEDPAAFVAALEQTVLRCNREQDANMIIRKRSGPSGDSYRIAVGDSSWKRPFGLAELPVFGFTKGLLLVAPNSASLDRLMDRAATEAAAGEPTRGLRMRANLPRFGGTLRASLLVVSALLGNQRAEFLSPAAMRWVDETLVALRNFGEVQIDLEQEPGAWRLHARLTPARQP